MFRDWLWHQAGKRPLRVIEAEVLDAAGSKIGTAPLFERYFLCRIPRFVPRYGGGCIYLHHYLRSDPDRGLHDHPWDHAIAVQLCAGYFEQRLAGFGKDGQRHIIRRRPPGRLYTMTGADFHRVLVENGAPTSWSLFIHGPCRKGWGFLRDGAITSAANGETIVRLQFRPVLDSESGLHSWWLLAQPGREQRRADARGKAIVEPPRQLGEAV